MGKLLTEDGFLTLPLYHGTSSYYWPSIKQNGLGGANIVEQWRLIPMLKEALSVLRSIDDEQVVHEMALRLPLLDSIAEQRVTRGGFNFRHGGVYLTCSPRRAVSYASRGFGSELVGQIAETMDLLEGVRPDAAAALLDRYPMVEAARSGEHRPVLIEVPNISLDRLRSDKGDDPHATVVLADSLFAMAADGSLQVDFELTGILEPREFAASEIEVTDWGYGFPKTWTSTALT